MCMVCDWLGVGGHDVHMCDRDRNGLSTYKKKIDRRIQLRFAISYRCLFIWNWLRLLLLLLMMFFLGIIISTRRFGWRTRLGSCFIESCQWYRFYYGNHTDLPWWQSHLQIFRHNIAYVVLNIGHSYWTSTVAWWADIYMVVDVKRSENQYETMKWKPMPNVWLEEMNDTYSGLMFHA